jgi:hypothetical protein
MQFFWIPEHCRVEVNEIADSQAKLSIKEAKIVKYHYQRQNLKPSGKKKAERSFKVSAKKKREGRRQRRKLL